LADRAVAMNSWAARMSSAAEAPILARHTLPSSGRGSRPLCQLGVSR
jgi:hypothetical protein